MVHGSEREHIPTHGYTEGSWVGDMESRPHTGMDTGKSLHTGKFEDMDVDDIAVKQSRFHLPPDRATLLRYPPSNHWFELYTATFTCFLHLLDILSELLLIDQFYHHNHVYAAAGLFSIYTGNAVTHIMFDWLNRGRLRYFLADILQLRPIIEYILYIRIWLNKRGMTWPGSTFRSQVAFESLFVAMPSLMVQTYVLLYDETKATWRQYFSFITSSLSAFISVLHYFKYLHVSNPTYWAMCIKAIINSAIRILLVALLAGRINLITIPCVIVSYLIGGCLYGWGVYHARTNGRDDPLLFRACHYAFGHLISTICLFVAFPFAPSHCVHDWWYGYLVSETKIQLENIAMAIAAIVTSNHSTTSQMQFYAACFFVGTQILANFSALFFMHRTVIRQLTSRGLYTNEAIVTLFAHNCQHLERLLNERMLARAGGDGSRHVVPDPHGMSPIIPMHTPIQHPMSPNSAQPLIQHDYDDDDEFQTHPSQQRLNDGWKRSSVSHEPGEESDTGSDVSHMSRTSHALQQELLGMKPRQLPPLALHREEEEEEEGDLEMGQARGAVIRRAEEDED